MRVLVLGAGGPAADNFIKSLRMGDSSAWVLGADTNPYLLELSTADETILLETRPDLEGADPFAHLDEVKNLVAEHAITLVHAQPDEEVLYLAACASFPLAATDAPLPIFLPDAGVVAACQDKLGCADLLGDLAPESHRAHPFPYNFLNSWDLAGLGNDAPKWMRARTGAGSLAAKMVRGFGDMNAWRQVWRGRVAPEDFMVSEYLPGRDVSYTSVWWRGEPFAAACRERVEYADTRTPSGQSSSPRVARLIGDRPVFDAGEEAVRRVNEACGARAQGVFYVDMKEDEDGVPRVTEINAGRFNTTQNFFAEAGCNLVDAYVRLFHGAGGQSVRRFERDGDVLWVRQPDMGHKLVVRAGVLA